MIRDQPLEYGDPVAYMLADRSGQGSCGRQYRPNTHLAWMDRRFPVDKWSLSAIMVTCSHVALCHPIPPGQECSKGKWPLAGAWEFSMFVLTRLAEVVKTTRSSDGVSAVDPGVG